MKTVLVTGATGFLGSYLVHALLDQSFKVVILKRSSSDVWRIVDVMDDVVSYDVDTQKIEKAFEENSIDIVIHTACNYGRNEESIKEVIETNLLFGLEVIEFSINFNIDTFINTDTLLHKHLNIYTRSKKQFTDWLKVLSNKIQVVNMKLELMYGPKDDSTKFVPWVITQLKQNVPEIKLTNGEQQRDFIYIDDVVSAYLTVLDKASELEKFCEFDVGTGHLIFVRYFLEFLKKTYEDNFGVIDTKLSFGALPYREGEMMKIDINNKLLKELGWSPKTDFQQGLKNILNNTK